MKICDAQGLSLGWGKLGCTVTAVRHVVQNITKSAAKDDPNEDWKFVDNDFKIRSRYYKSGSQARCFYIGCPAKEIILYAT